MEIVLFIFKFVFVMIMNIYKIGITLEILLVGAGQVGPQSTALAALLKCLISLELNCLYFFNLEVMPHNFYDIVLCDNLNNLLKIL